MNTPRGSEDGLREAKREPQHDASSEPRGIPPSGPRIPEGMQIPGPSERWDEEEYFGNILNGLDYP